MNFLDNYRYNSTTRETTYRQPQYNTPCYDEKWLPENYRHKDTADLCNWAANLYKKVEELAKTDPLPLELIGKLLERADAISAEVITRRKSENKNYRDDSTARAEILSSLDRKRKALIVTSNELSSLPLQEEEKQNEPLTKKCKKTFVHGATSDVKNDLNSMRKRKADASANEKEFQDNI